MLCDKYLHILLHNMNEIIQKYLGMKRKFYVSR